MAWIVFTAMWVVLACWAISPLTEWRMANRNLVFTYKGESVDVPSSVDRETLTDMLARHFPRSEAEKMAATYDPYARFEKLGALALQVISVPLVLLAFGRVMLELLRSRSKSGNG